MEQAILEKIATVPGVSSAELTSVIPIDGQGWHDPVFADDRINAESEIPPPPHLQIHVAWPAEKRWGIRWLRARTSHGQTSMRSGRLRWCDDVLASPEHLGIKVTFLAPADVAGGDLSKYDVILLAVRTYAAREDLRASNNRLIDCVKNGGVCPIQHAEYDHNYGLYAYTMGRNLAEVTDEGSMVTILPRQAHLRLQRLRLPSRIAGRRTERVPNLLFVNPLNLPKNPQR
jgi:hypothetical protein